MLRNAPQCAAARRRFFFLNQRALWLVSHRALISSVPPGVLRQTRFFEVEHNSRLQLYLLFYLIPIRGRSVQWCVLQHMSFRFQQSPRFPASPEPNRPGNRRRQFGDSLLARDTAQQPQNARERRCCPSLIGMVHLTRSRSQRSSNSGRSSCHYGDQLQPRKARKGDIGVREITERQYTAAAGEWRPGN